MLQLQETASLLTQGYNANPLVADAAAPEQVQAQNGPPNNAAAPVFGRRRLKMAPAEDRLQ